MGTRMQMAASAGLIVRDFDVVPFQLNGSTGSQTITGNLDGNTPIAALFVVSGATVLDTSTDNARISVGAYDGTNQVVITSMDEDALGTTDNYRNGATDEVIQILDGSGNVDVEANATGLGSDSVTINIGATNGTQYRGYVVLFYDESGSAHVGTSGLTNGGAQDITSVGFEPDIVFLVTHGDDINDTPGGFHILSMGFAVNGGNQACLMTRSEDGVTTSAITTEVRDNRIGGQMDNGSEFYNLTIGSYDASGFSLTHSGSDPVSDKVAWLALKLPNHQASVDVIDSATSTGDRSYTAPGFKPQLLSSVVGRAQSVNTVLTDASAEAFGVGAADAEAEQTSFLWSQDNVSTSNTLSRTDNVAMRSLSSGGTDSVKATLKSFDAQGFTLNYTVAPATAHKIPVLSIGAA